jgi:uncharacterized protein YecT (DUF1311 family)
VPSLRLAFRGFALSLVFLPISLIAFHQQAAAQALPPAKAPLPSAPTYDKSIFQNLVPATALAFLLQFDGAPSGTLYHNREFRHILDANIPNCIFHYGYDMPLANALDLILAHSPTPVQIRDRRFVLISGHPGPYLAGRGFIWIDMQDGIVLGGFFFHPTNGEPTPTLTAFSRQIKTKNKSIAINQLPPDFALDLAQWSAQSGIAPLTTRYFLTGNNKRILLEHTEDYCASDGGAKAPPPDDCEQMNADAADIDMNAAYYLEQVNYATNATAWMIEGQDQVEWLVFRDAACRVAPDRLACRIRLTRRRIRVIVTRKPIPHIPRR